MNSKETMKAAAVALSIVSAGATGCVNERGPSQADCNEVFDDSVPVDGACLETRFSSIEALSNECSGAVVKVMRNCPCGATTVPVWKCKPNEITQEKCDRVDGIKGGKSKPVNGACLSTEYPSVDAFTEACRNGVVTTVDVAVWGGGAHIGPASSLITVPVWTCDTPPYTPDGGFVSKDAK